jgi:hypothetical protein
MRYHFTIRSRREPHAALALYHRVNTEISAKHRRKSPFDLFYAARYEHDFKVEYEARYPHAKSPAENDQCAALRSAFMHEKWDALPPKDRDTWTIITDKYNSRMRQKKGPGSSKLDAATIARNWESGKEILPAYADAMSDWLGVSCTILLAGPMHFHDGAIGIRRFVDSSW